MNSKWELYKKIDLTNNTNFITEHKKPKLINQQKINKKTEKFPNFVFLGTGASLPSKYRNVTCTLIRIEYINKFYLIFN